MGEPIDNHDSSNSVSNSADHAESPPVKHLPSELSSSWQRPQGVPRGNWNYIRQKKIAEGYDAFLDGDPLTIADRKILDRYLGIENWSNIAKQPVIADFGCGSGRHSMYLAEKGFNILAIDLSIPMLQSLQQKDAEKRNLTADYSIQPGSILPLQSNLVELDGLVTDSIDGGICMFSTLGMIQGRQNRNQFLKHVRRVLKPSSTLIVHAHNLWFQTRHPGGTSWLITNGFATMVGKSEFGDRFADYRGINNMFIHSFRRSELKRDLYRAGFNDLEWFGVLPGSTEVVERPGLRHAMQLVGWVVVCR